MNKNKANDSQIKKLNDKAWAINRTNPHKSIDLSLKAVDLATISDNQGQIAIGKFIIGTAYIWISEYENSMTNLFEAKNYFNKTNNTDYYAKVCYSLGSCYYYLSNFDDSLKWFWHSLDLYTQSNDFMGQAEANNGIGSVMQETGQFEESVETLKKGYALLKKGPNDSVKARIIHGLGEATYQLGDYRRSELYFLMGIKLCKTKKFDQVLVFCNEGLAKIYLKEENFTKARLHLKTAISVATELKFKIGLASNLFLYGQLHLKNNTDKRALKYFYDAIEIAEEIGNISVRAMFHETMAEFYEKKEKLALAIYHLKEHTKFVDTLNSQKHGLHLRSLRIKINMERVEKENEIYKIRNKELDYRAKHLKKSNQRIETIADLGQKIASKLDLEELLNLIYNQINKLMTADILYIGILDEKTQIINFPFYIRDKERIHGVQVAMSNSGKFTVWCIKNEKELVLNDFGTEASEYITLTEHQYKDRLPHSVLIIPIKIQDKTIGVIGVHSYKKNSFTDDKIDVLKALGAYISIALENASVYKRVNDLYSLIENKNKEILDSINYSKRLQQAILPSNNTINSYFQDSFVFYRPKDIVAGDFYWINTSSDALIFAVADCTGHGVPGAITSVVCSNALSRVIHEYHITEPSQILNKTRELVIDTFQHSGQNVRDGMDIALCLFKENKIVFSGANSPLWLIRKNQSNGAGTAKDNELSLIELASNKQPIGLYEKMKDFDQTEFDVQKGDIIYFFTDGFVDQFGGKKGKKFMKKNFKALLLSIAHRSMPEQNELISNEFEKWKGMYEQVDDICVVGIKI